MNEVTEGRQKTSGRSTLAVTVTGGNEDEIELAALDLAKKYFGGDRRLAIVPGYEACNDGTFGEGFKAKVYVRPVEP